MPKSTTIFICQNCEASYPKWQGQCGDCGEWNSLVETVSQTQSKSSRAKKKENQANLDQKLISLSEVDSISDSKQRFSTGIEELDRVLGRTGTGQNKTSGLVPGVVILIGGEPGVGKSTLLTQVALNMLLSQNFDANSSKNNKYSVLYVCGEESPNQIGLRIKRFLNFEQKSDKLSTKNNVVKKMVGNNSLEERLEFVTSTDVDEIVAIIEQRRPSLVIVDSIQTLSTSDLTGTSGSVGQIRETTDRITEVVKRIGIPTFLVGHVTKDGTIAGPKVLEHMVDTVLELSGERSGQLRLLRAVKNRFGATDEVGVFQVVDWGMQEVTNPSQLFLEHADQAVPGSATVCILEGTRPLLVEVQALVVKSQLAMPRRVGRGIELSRIQVLAAVLQKHAGLPLGSSDVFLSAAGGFRVREPAVDLGLAVAVASSLKNKRVAGKTIFIGEVGLLGEIRSVSYLDQRIKEAKRLGFEKVISRQTHRRVKDVLSELGLS